MKTYMSPLSFKTSSNGGWLGNPILTPTNLAPKHSFNLFNSLVFSASDFDTTTKTRSFLMRARLAWSSSVKAHPYDKRPFAGRHGNMGRVTSFGRGWSFDCIVVVRGVVVARKGTLVAVYAADEAIRFNVVASHLSPFM